MPCEEGEPTPLLGSELCTDAGAVLCVVGVLCTVEAEPLDVPGAALCVVGVLCGVAVACTLDAEPLDAPADAPCGVDVEVWDGEGEPPRSG